MVVCTYVRTYVHADRPGQYGVKKVSPPIARQLVPFGTHVYQLVRTPATSDVGWLKKTHRPLECVSPALPPSGNELKRVGT
jgi:hypothetical protein